MHPERAPWHYGEGNGLFLLEYSPEGDQMGGMLLQTEGWYSSPSLTLEGISNSLTQSGEGKASPFPSLHIFSQHQGQIKSEFSPLLPSELFTAWLMCHSLQ